MIRVLAIHDTDGDRLYREFFDPAFVNHRLGTPGRWQGAAAQKLSLTDPVRLGDFRNLLQAQAPDGAALLRPQAQETEGSTAWRITLSGEGPASVALWELAPANYRAGIREAHNRAVQAALAEFERGLNGRPWVDNRDAPGRKSGLFAEFQAGATRHQGPRLHTNLFLFNLQFQKGAEHCRFALEDLNREIPRMGAAYDRAFAKGLKHLFGREVEVSPQLSLRFEGHPLRGVGQGPELTNRELFSAWREQAKGWGWGPERVGRLIAEARAQPTPSNLGQDGRKLLQMWTLWLRKPEHSPVRVLSAMMEGRDRQQPPSGRPSTRSQRSHEQGMSH